MGWGAGQGEEGWRGRAGLNGVAIFSGPWGPSVVGRDTWTQMPTWEDAFPKKTKNVKVESF